MISVHEKTENVIVCLVSGSLSNLKLRNKQFVGHMDLCECWYYQNKASPQKIQIVPVFFVDDALLSVRTENE